jgi:hypothetical protein
MTTHRALLTSALTIAGLCTTALPAFGQAPAGGAGPSPGLAPAPETAPAVYSPVQAIMAPKSPDDMTGSLGFGVGVIQNVELLGTTGEVALKYWMKDNLAFVPAFNFNLAKTSGMGSTWGLDPQLVALFVPFRSTSTRLLVGGGLGLAVGKAVPGGSTAFGLNLPIQAGVEHFFTRWFSLGIAAATNLFSYTHPGGGGPYSMSFDINTASLLGSLFFYTD